MKHIREFSSHDALAVATATAAVAYGKGVGAKILTRKDRVDDDDKTARDRAVERGQTSYERTYHDDLKVLYLGTEYEVSFDFVEDREVDGDGEKTVGRRLDAAWVDGDGVRPDGALLSALGVRN